MTINEILLAFRKFNPRLKDKHADKNTQVTDADIEDGKYFQQFKDNEKVFGLIVRGFKVIDGRIAYVQPEAKDISLKCDDEIMQCGGSSKVAIEVLYSLVGTFSDGSSVVVRDGRFENSVGAVKLVGDKAFTYDKPFIICQSQNDTESDRKAVLGALYYFNGVPYKCSKEIVQKPNSIQGWKLEGEEDKSIRISIETDKFPKEGGKSKVSVSKTFTRTSVRRDKCGNVVDSKVEEGLTEDITSKCLITISNKRDFMLLNGHVVANAQELDSSKKACVVTARYKDFTDSITISQEEGSKTEKDYSLSFDDGKPVVLIDLGTSALGVNRIIPVMYKELSIVDGVVVKEDCNPTANLKVSTDMDWLKAEYKSPTSIEVYTVEANHDRENDRECEVSIETADGKHKIKAIVSQSAAQPSGDSFKIACNTYEPFKSGSIDNVYFTVSHTTSYDDGTSDESNDYISGDAQVVLNYRTSDPKLSIDSINYIDGKYYPHFIDETKDCMGEVEISIVPYVVSVNDGRQLAQGEEFTVKTLPNEIVSYQYELCFEDHNKYIEVEFNDKEPKNIPVTSVMHTLVNGILKKAEFIPFEVMCVDKDRKEIRDDKFSNSYHGTSIAIEARPIKDEVSECRYIVKQQESGIEIDYKLSYKPTASKKVMLTVIAVRQNDITHDIWTDKGGRLIIDGNAEIKLNPCWLSPKMTDKVDTMFNGAMELQIGKHRFESRGVYLLNGHDKTRKPLNLDKEVTVSERTNSILLKFDIEES